MASWPLVRNTRSAGRPMTSDLTGSPICSCRDPLPGGDQRVPGVLPHIRQVHRGDPVGHLARAAQVVPFDPGGVLALLDLAGLIDRPDRQAAAADRAGGLIQARPRRTGAPPPSPRRCPSTARLSSRCVLSGVRSPACSAIVHPLRRRDLAHQRGGVLARLQPRLHPREARPQQLPAAQPASAGPARRLSWRQQPPSILLSSHTHDREAAAPVQPRFHRSAAAHNPKGRCRTRRAPAARLNWAMAARSIHGM